MALLYYITDRSVLGEDDASRRQRLLEKLGEAAAAGVDHVQLRERDLPASALEGLADGVLRRLAGSRTRLLINSRLDVALAVGAQGVHLRAEDIGPADARRACERAQRPEMLIAVSCHSPEDAAQAAREGADFAVFGPVFKKEGNRGQGVNRLREAVDRAGRMPVLALGGVTLGNAGQCLAVGAAGIAGIRLFQENRIEDTVSELRDLP
jgi:thiamine-phosphate pyrophosphorylase